MTTALKRFTSRLLYFPFSFSMSDK